MEDCCVHRQSSLEMAADGLRRVDADRASVKRRGDSSRLPSWVLLSNWPYHCSSQRKPLLLVSSHFAVQSQTLFTFCACLSTFIFPQFFFTGLQCCHCDLLQQPFSVLLPSVLRWDEVTLRYMSRFVGKTMVEFLFFFFLFES